MWRPNDISKIEELLGKGGDWILLINSATNVLKGDNYVFVFPDLLDNKMILKKGDVITSTILEETDLNLKSVNSKIKTLIKQTRDEIKIKGSIVNEISTRGDFLEKIRDTLQSDQNYRYKLEVVSLRDSKTADPVIVELNIIKLNF